MKKGILMGTGTETETSLGSTLLRHMVLVRRTKGKIRVVLVETIRSEGVGKSLVTGDGSGWRRQDERRHGNGALMLQVHMPTLRFSGGDRSQIGVYNA